MERWQIPGYDNRNTFNEYMAGLGNPSPVKGNKSIAVKEPPADIPGLEDIKKPGVDTGKTPAPEKPSSGSQYQEGSELLHKTDKEVSGFDKNMADKRLKEQSEWENYRKDQDSQINIKDKEDSEIFGTDPDSKGKDISEMASDQSDDLNIDRVGFKDGEVKKQLKWQETFFHEIFHQYDYNMGKGGYLSEIAKDTPWGKDPAMHNITNYTKKVQKASETAAESFTQLMNHVQDYTVINKGNFDMKDFMSYIEGDTYLGSYKYIIANYLDGTLF